MQVVRHFASASRAQSRIKQSITRSRIKYYFGGAVIGTVVFLDGLFNDYETFKSSHRFLRSFGIGAIVMADYAWNMRNLNEETEEYKKVMHRVHKRCATRILSGCLLNGGLYIKIGQGLSAINHILPREYVETLKQLEDKCLTRKENEIDTLFLEDFGTTPDLLFAEFDYNAIAAASLAQVFRAVTKNGEEVAVKVQYIDLHNRFHGDIQTILWLQDLVSVFLRDYNFGWVVRDLKASLLKELDFLNEAENSERCAKELQEFNYIHVPKVFWNYTGTRVLTTEFIHGYKISDINNIENDKLDLKDIDEKLFKIFAKQIFDTGFVHADPHPGNILVRKDQNGKAQLVLLDHGLYEKLAPDTRYNLCNFWEAIILKDYALMERHANALNVKDPEIFAEILLQRPFNINSNPSEIKTKLTEEDIVQMTKAAKERFDVIMKTLKEMPRNIIFVIRNLNTIRAIAREHGDVVHRVNVMARTALDSLRQQHTGFFGYFAFLKRKLYFEYRLMKMSFDYWLLTTYLNLLHRLGRSAKTDHLLHMEVEV